MGARLNFAKTMITLMVQAKYRAAAMTLMVVGSVIISFSGLIVRNIEIANPWQINIYRSIAFVSAILIVFILQHQNQTLLRFRQVGLPGVWAGIVLSSAGIAFTQALTHTTIANTMFTMSAIPFISAGLAHVFIKERVNSLTLAAMIASAFGVVVMVMDSFSAGNLYGNLMAIITTVCFAVFAVIVRANKQINMIPALLIAGLIIIIVSVIVSFDDLSITYKDLLLCILWGAGLSGFGHWIFIIASRQLIAAELTLFMLFEFALSPFWVWKFLDESPSKGVLIGGVIIITSVFAWTLVELRKPAKH